MSTSPLAPPQTAQPNAFGDADTLFNLGMEASRAGNTKAAEYLLERAVAASESGLGGTAEAYIPGLESRFGLRRDLTQSFWKSQARHAVDPKATPQRYNETLDLLGFYDGIKKPEDITGLTFRFLNSLCKHPIIDAVIKTRQFQVTRYAKIQNAITSQSGRSTETGLRIKQINDRAPLTPAVRKKIDELQNLLMHGGYHLDRHGNPRVHNQTGQPGVWDGLQTERAMPFPELLSVLVKQVLSLDFAPIRMEPGPVEKTTPVAWFSAVDATRIRRTVPRLYSPQIDFSLKGVHFLELDPADDLRVIREFDWSRMDALMLNPRTDRLGLGYGHSPLEVILDVLAITHLGMKFVKSWYDESAPQTIVTLSGQPTQMAKQTIEMLQMQMEMGSGPENWQRVLFMPFGKDSGPNPLQVIPLRQMTNGTAEVQMILGQMTQNVTMICNAFGMHSEEVGWAGVTQQKPTLNGEDPASKLEHSQEKGFLPLMERLMAFFNRTIIQRHAPELVGEWVNLQPKETQDPQHVQLLVQQGGLTPNQINDLNDVPRVMAPLDPQLMRDVRKKVKVDKFETDEDWEEAVNDKYEAECKKQGVKAWSDYPDMPINNPTAMGIIAQEQNANLQAKMQAQQQAQQAAAMGLPPGAPIPPEMMAAMGQGQMAGGAMPDGPAMQNAPGPINQGGADGSARPLPNGTTPNMMQDAGQDGVSDQNNFLSPHEALAPRFAGAQGGRA